MSSKRTKTYRSFSPENTKKFAEGFARTVRSLKRGPIVIALEGDLGAGKTTFVQGFFKGLGVKKRVASPTFIIVRRHSLKKPFKNLFHMDAYRLKNADQLKVLEFEKMVRGPGNIVLIEWADRIKKALPKGGVWLRFRHGRKENERKISY